MCCGEEDIPLTGLQEDAMEEARTVRAYAARPGDVLTVAGFGVATTDEPALVSETVAQELEASAPGRFRMDRDASAETSPEPETPAPPPEPLPETPAPRTRRTPKEE